MGQCSYRAESCQSAQMFEPGCHLGKKKKKKKGSGEKKTKRKNNKKEGRLAPSVVSLSYCMVSHIQQPHRSCFMCSR